MNRDNGVVFSTDRLMISARGEIEVDTFTKVLGKQGIWYVTTKEAKADGIYVSTSNKEGMGGSTCSFLLEDGTTDEVVAPWHSNSDALLEDTGVDVTNLSLISYIIAEDKECVYPEDNPYRSVDTYYGILELVEDKLINFNTSSERGKYFANKLGKKVFVTRVSSGGSSKGWAVPDEEENKILC